MIPWLTIVILHATITHHSHSAGCCIPGRWPAWGPHWSSSGSDIHCHRTHPWSPWSWRHFLPPCGHYRVVMVTQSNYYNGQLWDITGHWYYRTVIKSTYCSNIHGYQQYILLKRSRISTVHTAQTYTDINSAYCSNIHGYQQCTLLKHTRISTVHTAQTYTDINSTYCSNTHGYQQCILLKHTRISTVHAKPMKQCHSTY